MARHNGFARRSQRRGGTPFVFPSADGSRSNHAMEVAEVVIGGIPLSFLFYGYCSGRSLLGLAGVAAVLARGKYRLLCLQSLDFDTLRTGEERRSSACMRVDHSSVESREIRVDSPMMLLHLPPNGRPLVPLPSLREQRVDLLHPHGRAQSGEERLGFFEEALARRGVALEARERGTVEQDERCQARRTGLVDEPVGLAQGVADGRRCRSACLDEEHMCQRP